MAGTIPFPNREINDGQKEIFAHAIERLEPFITLDTPTPERLLEMDERRDQDIEVHKIGHFVMNGAYFKLEISEIIDETDEGLATLHTIWTATMQSAPVDVADQRFVTAELFFVVKTAIDDSWTAEYEGHTTVQGPQDRYPRFCRNEHELEREAFYCANPTDTTVEERRAELREEAEENDSEVPLDQRFTQARMTGILKPLTQLDGRHVVDSTPT